MKSRNFLSSLSRYLLFLVIVIALIIEGVWLISVSEETVRKAISGALGNRLGMEITGLKKGLFYNLNAERVALRDNDRDIIFINDVSARINPVYLFLLRHKSSFKGRVHKGFISGDLNISRNKMVMYMKVNRVDIRDIPYLKAIGIKGDGALDADIMLEDNHGGIKFNLNNAKLETLTLSGIALPLEAFDSVKGMINVDSSLVNIESLSLEGDGVYGRIKGKIKDGLADLSFEIMPDASAISKFPILAFIEKYKVSPGYYVIPVKMKISF